MSTDKPELGPEERAWHMGKGMATGWLSMLVRSPGIDDSRAFPFLRDFLELSESRNGVYALLASMLNGIT